MGLKMTKYNDRAIIEKYLTQKLTALEDFAVKEEMNRVDLLLVLCLALKPMVETFFIKEAREPLHHMIDIMFQHGIQLGIRLEKEEAK